MVLANEDPPPSRLDAAAMTEIFRQHEALLKEMARTYIWWMTPDEAFDFPQRIVAQVMNVGTFRDSA